jgi:hypothetical protein
MAIPKALQQTIRTTGWPSFLQRERSRGMRLEIEEHHVISTWTIFIALNNNTCRVTNFDHPVPVEPGILLPDDGGCIVSLPSTVDPLPSISN